jgi:hypothetical protein
MPTDHWAVLRKPELLRVPVFWNPELKLPELEKPERAGGPGHAGAVAHSPGGIARTGTVRPTRYRALNPARGPTIYAVRNSLGV